MDITIEFKGKKSPATLIATLIVFASGFLLLRPAFSQDIEPAENQGTVPQWEVLDQYCLECHNLDDYSGGVAFDLTDRDNLHTDAPVWEMAIRKLRTGLMPPSGQPRPRRAVLDEAATWLENELDQDGTQNPGAESLSRLNRTEYRNAVRDLLALDADRIISTLPEDVITEGFDNNAEAMTISPTLLESYIDTAMEISRLAVGDVSIGPTDFHYSRDGEGVQNYHMDGQAPGTRGGMTIQHNFPLDAEYEFRISADIRESGWKNDEGRMWWCNGPSVDVAFNGIQVPVEDYRSFRLQVPAGPQQISAALVDDRKCAGAVELYLGEALASVGGSVQEIEIQGPFNVTGVGDTPSRRRIFICRPETAADEPGCAREIMSNLATRAFRRPVPVNDDALDDMMGLYNQARETEGGNFELGIQYALSRLLVDPEFLYRFEEIPEGINPGEIYALNDLELASRLSFFLWSSIPDEELLTLAIEQKLSEPEVLARQVERMLADEKSWALVENFAGQWLNLRDLDEATPQDEDFDEALRQAFRQETELFFASIMQEDGSVLELLDADYTYMNERLAIHYGFEGIRGSYMRRVNLQANSPRRGLLGQGSILTSTSNPNRTSPVVRGVWVVENLLGAPVPEPPPGVETDLAESTGEAGAVPETLRERLELHRQDAVCAGCHGIMDPVGLALENFDMVGRWRETDNGQVINTESQLTDGTKIQGPENLRQALLSRPQAFLTSFTEHLLSYALGRDIEYYDGPAVRKVVRQASTRNYSFTTVVAGIVNSDPFRKRIFLEENQTRDQLALSRE